MKLKITLAFISLAFVFSCKKETGSDALIGKWRTTEIFFMANTSGGPLYIQFIWPGKVQSTYITKCTGYSTDGNTLTLKYTGAPVSQATYTYTIKQDTLTLYPGAGLSGGNMIFVKE